MKTSSFVDAFGLLGLLSSDDLRSAEYTYYTILGDIGRTLVEYRISHQMNQSQLAATLDVSQSMVSKYESGDYNISVRALCDLCEKLGLSLRLSIDTPNACRSNDSSFTQPPSVQDAVFWAA